MDIKIEIEKEELQKLLKDAEKTWDSQEFIEKDEKGKCYTLEFDNIQCDGAEIEHDDLRIYGDWKKDSSMYYTITLSYDSYILGKMVEFIVKSLNRFKSAIESIGSI